MPLTTADAAIRECPIPLTTALAHPERFIAEGTVVRVRHGVYAPADLWRELAPWDRYLARVHAASVMLPDAVFCLESAAALAGLPVFGDPVSVHILVPHSSASRLNSGVRSHRARRERAVVTDGGVMFTGLADTAVDLCRHRHNAVGLAVADAVLRRDPTLDADRLLAVNGSRASARGRAIARWPLSRATGLAESPLESVSRAVIEWLGLPGPELQVSFAGEDRRLDGTDFLWRDAGVAGEADGDLKYDGRFGDAREALHRQSARDRRLRRHLHTVAHWDWTDVTAVAPLRGILVGAGVRAVEPEDSARLYTTRRLLTTAHSAR